MKMFVTRALRCAAFLLVLSACATGPPLNTPSQRPEVMIVGASKKEILDRIVSVMVGVGAQLKRMDAYSAVFGKVEQSFAASVLYGSRYDIYPEMRFTYTLVDSGPAVRVFIATAMVRNPGSAFEGVTEITDSRTMKQMQEALERLKGDMERK